MTDQPGPTVWEALRERHQQVLDDKDPFYIECPIHPGVVLRYRYLPIRETIKPQKRLAKIKDPVEYTLASACETLLLSLEEIMIAAPDGEIPKGVGGRELYEQPVKPLSEDGIPLRFDERLCEQMEFPARTAESGKKIVMQWFAGKEYTVIEHAQEVSAWFTEVSDEVREDFAGELGKA